MVRADSHRNAVFLAELDQRGKLFPDTDQFRLAYCVGVFPDSEPLLIRVVAWIDAYLFHPFGRFHGRFRLEVNVCHQRHIAAMRAEAFAISRRLAASLTVGAVILTISQPTATSSSDWRTH